MINKTNHPLYRGQGERMQGISVEFVDKMGSDISVSNSARVSFGKWKEEFDEKDAKLIDFLAREEHMTPFRHNAIQVRCKAPIFIARQLGKHQAGLSWNEISRRYVDTKPEFFIPEVWRSRPEGGIKQGSGGEFSEHEQFNLDYDTSYDEWNTGNIYESYDWIVANCIDLYEQMLKKGVAPEMARMILPQSILTEWIWTGNLLAFAHVYKLRIGEHAQVEAQQFAKELDKICREHFPVAWSALVD